MKPNIIDTFSQILKRSETLARHYFVPAMFLLLALSSLSYPIQYHDSDLWYHMTGGRYLVENGTLYNPFVNSYLEHKQTFINYFWGFQWLVWITWDLSGSAGLIVIKSLFVLASALLAARVILGRTRLADASIYYQLAIFLVISIIAFRVIGVRPHLITFAMIPAFFYIIEQRRELYPLLPLLTLIWANTHGVEWIVGGLICGSYFGARLLTLVVRSDDARPDEASPASHEIKRDLIWIAACLPVLLINPNGWLLFLTPFIHNPDLSLFVSEMVPVKWSAAIDLNDGLRLENLLLVHLIVVFIAAGTLIYQSLVKGPLPDSALPYLAQLLIAAGAIVLLTMGQRFIWEYVLLTTPLLSAAMTFWPKPRQPLVTVGLPISISVMLAMTFLPGISHGMRHYPYIKHSLPYGTTEFIKQHNITGRYAVSPSHAGYIEFELSPDVQIHMDMQFPPFTALDFHDIQSALISPKALQRYIRQYEPVMIGAVRASEHFPDAIARQEGYQPVFYDQQLVLYLDSKRYPDVVEKFGMKAVNPFQETKMRAGQIDQAADEIERLLAVVEMPETRSTLIATLIESGRLERAGIVLNEMQVKHPDHQSIPYYSAKLAHLKQDCDVAIPLYSKALVFSKDRELIHRQLAECFFLTGQQRKAYEHFRQAINPYRNPNPETLAYYQFALSAVGAGEPDEAVKLLAMILQFDPDTPIRSEIEVILSELGQKTN